MERQVLAGAQYDPLTIYGHGAVGDSLVLAGFAGCARFADAFEPMGRTRAQLSRKSVQRNSVRIALGDDEETAIRRDEKRLGIVRAVRVGRMEDVFHGEGAFGARRFLYTIDGDARAPGIVVADVGHVEAPAVWTWPNGDSLPVFNRDTGQTKATSHGTAPVEREENRLSGVVVRPEPTRNPTARGDAACFRQLRDRRDRPVRPTLRVRTSFLARNRSQRHCSQHHGKSN
jgi:hypothetical protein